MEAARQPGHGRPIAGQREPSLVLVILSAVLIFGTIVGAVTWFLREEIRRQIVDRVGAVLYPVVTRTVDDAAETAELELVGVDPREFAIEEVMQEAAGLPDLRAVHVLDELGLPIASTETNLEINDRFLAESLASLLALEPSTAFFGSAGGSPRVDVIIPLHRSDDLAVFALAYYQLDGSGIARELTRLDRNLGAFAAVAWVAGSLLLASLMVWAFRRLQRANALLEERTKRLIALNHELTLASKSSALGGVTAHLIHGLRNPLSGLRDFVAARADGEAAASDEGWNAAVESAERMDRMIREVVEVLRDQEGTTQFDYTFDEMVTLLSEKAEPVARMAGVRFSAETAVDGEMPSHRANLILLSLWNLIENGIQAAAPSGTVGLKVTRDRTGLVFAVDDTGPGIPPELVDRLFHPVRSVKSGGSGIGLAISAQLARHAGAELRLVSTGAEGSRFELRVAAEGGESI